MSSPILVTHVSGCISRNAGGLFQSVRYLTQETAQHNIDINVLSLKDQFSTVDMPQWDPLEVYVYPVIGPARFGWSPGLARHLMLLQDLRLLDGCHAGLNQLLGRGG